MISAIVVLLSTEVESQPPSPSCNDKTQITIVGTRHFADAARFASFNIPVLAKPSPARPGAQTGQPSERQ